MDSIELLRFKVKDISRINNLKSRIVKRIKKVDTYCSTSLEPVPYSNVKNIKFKKINPGYIWAKKSYNCAWFKFKGIVPDEIKNKHYFLEVNIGGEGLLYENGVPSQMITDKFTYTDHLSLYNGKFFIDLKGQTKFDLLMDAGFNGAIMTLPVGFGYFKYAYISTVDDNLIKLYYDYVTVVTLKHSKNNDKEIESDLSKAYKYFMNYKYDEAQKVLDKYLLSENPIDFKYYAVGHSHLDLAWLWPIRETKRKSRRTFINQINNIKHFDEYIYGASQPWQFEYLKNNEPKLFEQIKEYVKLGRIEPQGSMYVEADTNISSGEALVRQIYYGKTFFKKEFNKDIDICWLPDVFGYNGNLPQILKKTGTNYFYTIKLSWNEQNKFPYRSFNWEGIDDSKVLVHMSPTENYCSCGSPMSLRFGYFNYPEKDKSKIALYTYGVGDGGGGPCESHIELLKRSKSLYDTPKVIFSDSTTFFKELEKDKDKLPSYKGELYLEKHQGTYTTQGRNKRFNRLLEFNIEDLEAMSFMATLKGYKYNQELIDELWKETLLYQFHDIIPGSSINRVYKESRQRYEEMLDDIKLEREKIYPYLGSQIKHLSYNPTSFERIDTFGKYYCNASPYSISELVLFDQKSSLDYGPNYISNSKLKVEFNNNSEIISLKDNDSNEYVKTYLNRFKLFFDKPRYYNAWDISMDYLKHKGRTLKPYKVETYIEDLKVIRKSYFRFNRSKLIETISLDEFNDFVRVDVDCNFKEKFKMLRSISYPNVDTDKVTCDIQFGNIKRSTNNISSIEKAQFEICAQKYVDISDNKLGLSLINDCKYGHRVKDNMISLNLLRSPIFPDTKADIGKHHFSYCFYPHKGEMGINTVKHAYNFNKPMYLFEGEFTYPSFVESTNKGIVIESFKKAYDDDSLILRCYEALGKDAKTSINVSMKYKETVETDLLENKISNIDLTNIKFKPFEIKTIKIIK